MMCSCLISIGELLRTFLSKQPHHTFLGISTSKTELSNPRVTMLRVKRTSHLLLRMTYSSILTTLVMALTWVPLMALGLRTMNLTWVWILEMDR